MLSAVALSIPYRLLVAVGKGIYGDHSNRSLRCRADRLAVGELDVKLEGLLAVQTRRAGRVRSVTFGAPVVLSKLQAASAAQSALANALAGNDPAKNRYRIRSAPSLNDILQEYWHKCASASKPTAGEILTKYRYNHVDGAPPVRFIVELDRREVAKWFADVTNRSGPRRQQPGP